MLPDIPFIEGDIVIGRKVVGDEKDVCSDECHVGVSFSERRGCVVCVADM
jgi:hypothetical protein